MTLFMDYSPKRHVGLKLYEVQSTEEDGASLACIVESDASHEEAAKAPWHYLVEDVIAKSLVGIFTFKGGKGSGHKGHAGRPGFVGGSLRGVGGVSPVQHGEYSVYTVGKGEKLPRHITHEHGMLIIMFDPDTKQLHVAPEHTDHATLAFNMEMSAKTYDNTIRGVRWEGTSNLTVENLGIKFMGGGLSVFGAAGREYDPAKAMNQVKIFARALRDAGFPDPDSTTLRWIRPGEDIELPLAEWKEYIAKSLVGIFTFKGGKGSGHKGHAGRPGFVGGSLRGVGGQMSMETAVGLYTETSPINWDLRKGRELDPQSRRIVETIDSGMKPLEQDITLYRGIKPIKSRETQTAIYGTDKRIIEGIEFSDGGYSSTSSTVFDARKFAGTDGTIWRIHAKKGQPALDLGKFSGYVERETLLPRGTKFKVVGRDYDEKRDMVFLDLEIV